MPGIVVIVQGASRSCPGKLRNFPANTPSWGYCWDHRKIPWATIPNDPWYFIRRNLKTNEDLAAIFWNFCRVEIMTSPFSQFLLSYQSFQWILRFRQSDPVSFSFEFSFNRFHHHSDRPSPWPSIIVTVTVIYVCKTVNGHGNRRLKQDEIGTLCRDLHRPSLLVWQWPFLYYCDAVHF